MAGKVSGICCFGIVLNVKQMTLESDSVPGLEIVFCIANIAFKAIN